MFIIDLLIITPTGNNLKILEWMNDKLWYMYKIECHSASLIRATTRMNFKGITLNDIS